MSQDKIRIHSIDYRGSVCDGPGIRTVIYLQGCTFCCEGCHNPQTWDMNNGYLLSVDELHHDVISKTKYKRVTISGGEPLLQEEGVYKLITLLKKEGFDIALYTGFDIIDIPERILSSIDYVKCGRFIQHLKSTIIPYVGSSNQRFICLQKEGNYGE